MTARKLVGGTPAVRRSLLVRVLPLLALAAALLGAQLVCRGENAAMQLASRGKRQRSPVQAGWVVEAWHAIIVPWRGS